MVAGRRCRSSGLQVSGDEALLEEFLPSEVARCEDAEREVFEGLVPVFVLERGVSGVPTLLVIDDQPFLAHLVVESPLQL